MVRTSVNSTSRTAALMVVVRFATVSTLIEGGTGRERVRQELLHPADGVDHIGAGLLVNEQQDAAVAVLPGGQQVVLGAVHGDADVADAHRGAVLIGDHHVVPWRGFQQLVVVVDGESRASGR